MVNFTVMSFIIKKGVNYLVQLEDVQFQLYYQHYTHCILLLLLYYRSDVESSFGDDILNDLMKNNCLWGNILNQLEYVPSIFIKNQVFIIFLFFFVETSCF